MNRKILFDIVRKTVFGGRLSKKRVEGMNFLLDTWEENHSAQPIEFLAYPLATTVRETGYAMRPIKERGGH